MTIVFPSDQLEAFRLTAEVVAREARHLEQTRARLSRETIDAAWVTGLDGNPDLAERVEAFAARFGRLQDTLGDKLLPRMAMLAGMHPMAPVELLARAEGLAWIHDANEWMEWRKLRNRLVHEYVANPDAFARPLNHALAASTRLLLTESRIRGYATTLGLLA